MSSLNLLISRRLIEHKGIDPTTDQITSRRLKDDEVRNHPTSSLGPPEAVYFMAPKRDTSGFFEGFERTNFSQQLGIAQLPNYSVEEVIELQARHLRLTGWLYIALGLCIAALGVYALLSGSSMDLLMKALRAEVDIPRLQMMALEIR